MVDRARILLVNPRCLDQRVTDQDATVVPIGLYYIAAVLREEGHEVAILNLAEGSADPVQMFRRSADRWQPGIIGFSVMNPNRWNAIDCAKTAKQLSQDATVIFGGPAATFMTDTLFHLCPELDFVVKGEGESTFLELVEHLCSGNANSLPAVRGIAFRQDKKIVHAPDRDLCNNLDLLPHPSRYFVYQHLSMSRGCPGSCTFCGSPRFWGKRCVRFHSAQWFADEIQALARKGVTHFYISDDTFTMDRERVIDLCQRIEKQAPGITWNAISRVDYIDDAMLRAMRKAGCIQISFGVESGSKKIRNRLGKPVEKKKIIEAFATARRFGILPRAYFIYGSPEETDQTIVQSIELMREIRPLGAVFYMLVIFPGTRLYRIAVQTGQIPENIWHRRIEDIPWFEVDPELNFETVKTFGDRLRDCFYGSITDFAQNIDLIDEKDLYPCHADFLSRLAMTFSHGEYATDPRVKDSAATAVRLYEQALRYAPDKRAFMGLGMLLQKQGRFDEAITLLERGLRRFPDHADLNICMGLARMNQGRFDMALAVFEKFADLPQASQYINICKEKLSG